ncbi:MAG: alpha,alpha-trehalose-phosphate synthase [Hyphomonas sp. BRH_c22]|uniref:alpha,alpha-trehalose-phosphate synthase (UDP-forming) n=1 Tax=Hyphomonas sp. BRH_c22 TaxID=1629710 RepID=UPI0005F0FEDD|nr:trehalose-6-phosphate synthase [Hyphomonas sp. BRH_c22]KJS39867.1 MAG: alpha,alpha-trehalose-phosphate synthase [Hyphomonas sp. BRH_c22]MBU2534328.1 trehalose-6-phosphate synthase [Alphaproteobacteria bacterium]
MIKTRPHSSRRLVAVSNRTSFGSPSAGGLAVALSDTLAETGGLWIGWSGKIFDMPRRRVHLTEEGGVSFALIDMSKSDYEGFYLGYANSVLWPVMHNRLDLAVFDSDYLAAYTAINQQFARAISDQTAPSDLIWVQDYHFFLIAKQLKDAGCHRQTGFFLHIPFPAPEVFRSIPDHRLLGEGLCAYDVVGLQSPHDCKNFTRYIQEELGAEQVGEERYRIGDHTFTLRLCPIGIDAESFSQSATSDAAENAARKLAKFLGDRHLIIGVDRMDYSKGLPQRFEGMATLFDKYPVLHGSISFTQIAPPSRSVVEEYAQLRQQLDELSGRINGDYGDLDWIPIRYLARGYERDELAGLYRLARVGLVTPLQDGMNLVAKEYIAAQDPDDPGVLVLSQFAGAAEQMKEALIINPHDRDAVADSVLTALNMPLEERKRRWRVLYDGICRQDITWWREHFLSAFDSAPAGT